MRWIDRTTRSDFETNTNARRGMPVFHSDSQMKKDRPMNSISRNVSMAILALMFAGTAATAFASPPSPSDDSPDSSAASESTIASLQRLIASHEVTEVRSSRNGSYSASLLFQADTLSYFVTLSHDQSFWRVIQTESVKDAETTFHAFADQTAKLAEVDIDTLRLEAGKRYAQHLVAMNESRLHKLQQDALLQQRQGQQVAALQEQGRQKAVALSGDLRATSSQLDEVQQNIHKLEAEQGNPALNLPAGATSSAGAASLPAPADTSQTSSP
jgi:hypothetical protein